MTRSHRAATALRIGATLLTVLSTRTAARADRVCAEPLPPLDITIANNAVTSVDHGDGTYTLYSFMGITNPNSSSTITAASFRFDGPDGPWVSIADAPLLLGRAKIGANAIVVAGEVYLIGGYSVAGGERTEDRLFRYDPEADDYVELAPVPIEVDDTVAAVYQDRYLYLVSGWHGPINNNVANVQVYDTQTNAWAQATPIPGPLPGLFGHAGTIIDDRILYMDGTKISGGFVISNSVFAGRIDPKKTGDVTTIEWEQLPAHPGRPTYRGAASQGTTPGGRMLLVGGTDNPYNFNGTGYNGQPAHPLPQVLAGDGDSWEDLPVFGFPTPTMDHRGLVRAGDGWVTIGGMTGPGAATDLVLRYRVIPDAPPGDLDCDGLVGFSDVLIILSAWGPCPEPPVRCPADLDEGGDVGFSDLLIALSNWS